MQHQSSASRAARSTEDQCMEAIREEESRMGRPFTPREREAFSWAFRAEFGRLAAWKVVRS